MSRKRTNRPNTLVFLSSIAIGLYLAALVGYAYFGQQRLRDALLSQDRLLVAQQALVIADFLHTQQVALHDLAKTPAIKAYLVERTLRRLPTDRLASDRQVVLGMLEARRTEHLLQGLPAFRRLAVIDNHGNRLVDTGKPESAETGTGDGAERPQGVGVAVARDSDDVVLRLSAPALFDGDHIGFIIGEMPSHRVLQPLLQQLMETGKHGPEPGLSRTAVLDPDGTVIAAAPSHHWPSHRADDLPGMLASSIEPYGLTLIALPDQPLYDTLFTSPIYLGAMAILALPLFIAVNRLWRANNHQLILRTKLQASRQQRERLRLRNERLRHEIDRRVASEQELTHQANYDQLTGLPNRNLALDRLDQAIRWARREDSSVLALFIDLDRFKQVNDSLGHAAGDELLREASRRLQSKVRERDTVSRLGGDEFLVICTGGTDQADREQIAQLLLQTLSAPFYIDDHEFFVGGSIGMAAFPEGGDTPHTLLKNADIAMYAAKENGRNGYAVYDPSMDASAMETVRLERNLRHALANEELSLVFQPIVDLVSGRTTAFEALLRWSNKELGDVSPDRFIPVAEETGLIHDIGEWMMREACATLGSMRRDSSLKVAVNLSSKQFSHPGRLLDCVLDALRTSGLMPEQLEIEITESILIDDRPEIAGLIDQLDRIGVRLSLDDFGTGYSALNYLQRFPFDVLKIDRTFTRQIPESQANASLIRAIIAMAHALDLEVVAEGIETRQQAGFLLVYHCEFGQGYLYSKPLSANQLSQHLSQETALSA